MRICTLLLFFVPLFAQEPPPPAPKNLKLLKAENLMPAMKSFTVALGVK